MKGESMERETDAFWKGKPGDAYTVRNHQVDIKGTVAFFENAIAAIDGIDRDNIETILELGANVGYNLQALGQLLPGRKRTGVEINANACRELREVADHVRNCSFLELDPVAPYDLVLTKGVLIHIAPADLPLAYDVIHAAADRWILIAEYYSPTPVEKDYRGERGRLWKRDFAGEMMETFRDLQLVDYGFHYHLDPHPQDDITWFLLEKRP